MNASELIEKLKEAAPNAEVYFDDSDKNGHLWDVRFVEIDSEGDIKLSAWK